MNEKIPRIPHQVQEKYLDVASYWDAFVIFAWSYGWLVVLAILIFVGLILVWRKLKIWNGQIQQVWVYILFFLTKRQMLIPLIITLSSRDGLLDNDFQEKLLDIRDQCRKVSLKKHPQKRLQLETQVSQILFFYFSRLEKKNQIKPGTKFEKIVRDLEFIDQKLVHLQRLYNQEVTRWNSVVKVPGLSPGFRGFGFRGRESFQD